MSGFNLGKIMGLQVASNSQDPGTGQLAAIVVCEPEGSELVNGIYYADGVKVYDATARRFPDLQERPDWEEFGNRFKSDVVMVSEAMRDVKEWFEEGGCVAVWDAPDLHARLAPYGIAPLARIIDLKVLNRLMLPRQRGYRNPGSMAAELKTHMPTDLMPGVEYEAQMLQILGQQVGNSLLAGKVPGIDVPPASWKEVMWSQSLAAHSQLNGLIKYRNKQGKTTDDIKPGWPVWQYD